MTTSTILALALTAATAPLALAQQDKAAPEANAMLAMAVERSLPGPEHARLAALAGRWKQEVTWTIPGMAPVRYTALAENRWVLGGRFLECRSAGEGAGRAFESLTLFGYDTRKHQYFAVGMDTTGSYYVNPHGRYNEATGTFDLEGDELNDSGDGTFHYRMLTQVLSPDRHVVRFVFEFPGREPVTVAEVVHTRQ